MSPSWKFTVHINILDLPKKKYIQNFWESIFSAFTNFSDVNEVIFCVSHKHSIISWNTFWEIPIQVTILNKLTNTRLLNVNMSKNKKVEISVPLDFSFQGTQRINK